MERDLDLAGQVAAGLLVATAGAIHLYLYFDYFHRVHVIGVLFLVNAAAGLLIGRGLLVRRDRILLLAAGSYVVGTLVAFAVSTRWGLFGYRETFWGTWQEAAAGIELAAACRPPSRFRYGRRKAVSRSVVERREDPHGQGRRASLCTSPISCCSS